MKFRITSVAVSFALALGQGTAIAGGAGGGATEITQIANNLQLIHSYQQQVASYIRQGLQLQNELKNLIANPTSLLGPEVGQMINTIGSIWKSANSMGYNLAEIDRNFSTMFKSPKAGDFAKMFTKWHQVNTNTLESAMKAVGVHRENYASTQAALTELYNRSQSTNGNLDALQTLSQINIRQIQELHSLQELMSSQSQASLTYMATETAKAQKGVEDVEEITKYNGDLDIPRVTRSPGPKWKGFGH